jgi:hypothetical protein
MVKTSLSFLIKHILLLVGPVWFVIFFIHSEINRIPFDLWKTRALGPWLPYRIRG